MMNQKNHFLEVGQLNNLFCYFVKIGVFLFTSQVSSPLSQRQWFVKLKYFQEK